MAQTSISAEEHWQRAQELYERELRAKVETPENIGKLIIDVDSGDYEIEDDSGDRTNAMLGIDP